jgi:peptidoglycan/LPS O-acetylase OafA/YrhL
MVYVSHMGLGRSYTGGQGVAIFFFLSGYLITTLMRTEAFSAGTISITKFYIRRVFRILPPLYVTMLVAVLLYPTGMNPELTFAGLASVVLYYSNFYMLHHRGMGGLGGTWSLSVEEHFYFIFPFIFVMTARLSRKSQAMILGITCTAVLVWRCLLAYWMHADPSRIYLFTDTRFDSILLGALLALWANPLFDRIPSWFSAHPRVFAAIGALGALGIDHVPVVNRAVSFSLLGLSLFPVFWFVIVYWEDPYIRWIENTWLRTIGRWSYSLYLVHPIIITAIGLKTHLSQTWCSLLAIAPCLMYGWGMEKFVEKPSHRLRNFVMRKRQVRQGVTVG